jgi:hypothetical protein
MGAVDLYFQSSELHQTKMPLLFIFDLLTGCELRDFCWFWGVDRIEGCSGRIALFRPGNWVDLPGSLGVGNLLARAFSPQWLDCS